MPPRLWVKSNALFSELISRRQSRQKTQTYHQSLNSENWNITDIYTTQDSRTRIIRLLPHKSSQFLVTEKSARHSTRLHYFYCPSPDFTSRCADCRADTRGHFNCLSVGNKQLCPLMWGHKRKVGAHQKIFGRRLCPLPNLQIASDATAWPTDKGPEPRWGLRFQTRFTGSVCLLSSVV